MSTDITLTAPSPTKMALVTLSILVGLALLYPAWLALRTGMDSPSFLPEPTAVQTPYHQSASPHELALFTATALQPAYNNRESYRVPLEYGDHRKFKGHLAHISARNGWFLYHSGRTLFKVVVPRSQIDRLKDVETDPLGWGPQPNPQPARPPRTNRRPIPGQPAPGQPAPGRPRPGHHKAQVKQPLRTQMGPHHHRPPPPGPRIYRNTNLAPPQPGPNPEPPTDINPHPAPPLNPTTHR